MDYQCGEDLRMVNGPAHTFTCGHVRILNGYFFVCLVGFVFIQRVQNLQCISLLLSYNNTKANALGDFKDF